MSRSLPSQFGNAKLRPPVSRRGLSLRGMTLVELMIAMTITAMITVILGGLVLAVHTVREYSEGSEEVVGQTQASFDRIQYMVSQTGVYRVDGRPTVPGIAVVNQTYSDTIVPNILVVWSGGSFGGMSAKGVQSRLPLFSELVIYTTDPDDPSQLVEMTFPGDSSSIDFQAADFDATILQYLSSGNPTKTKLYTRIHTISTSSNSAPDSTTIGAVRFDPRFTPSDSDLAATAPLTDDWLTLNWAQGIVATDSGMRQVTIAIELQLEIIGKGSGNASISPFWGSASYRYVHEQ